MGQAWCWAAPQKPGLQKSPTAESKSYEAPQACAREGVSRRGPRVRPGETSAHLLSGELGRRETAGHFPVASAPSGRGSGRQRNAVCRLGC